MEEFVQRLTEFVISNRIGGNTREKDRIISNFLPGYDIINVAWTAAQVPTWAVYKGVKCVAAFPIPLPVIVLWAETEVEYAKYLRKQEQFILSLVEQ